VAKARITQAERGKSVESGFGRPMAAEEFRTILVTYFTTLHSVRVCSGSQALEAGAQHHGPPAALRKC
jgi:hypothetical protein